MDREKLKTRLVNLKDSLSSFYDTPAWQVVVQATNEALKGCDAVWHIYDESSKEFKELKVRKRALTYLLNIEKILQSEIDSLNQQLFQDDNTDIKTPKYYDLETKTEQSNSVPKHNYGID